jgi:hypothetical protein
MIATYRWKLYFSGAELNLFKTSLEEEKQQQTLLLSLFQVTDTNFSSDDEAGREKKKNGTCFLDKKNVSDIRPSAAN